MCKMASKYCTFWLISALHYTIFPHTSSTRTEAKSTLICRTTWQKLQINWKTTLAKPPTNNDSSLFWRENEQEFENLTASRLLDTVKYTHNFTKHFECTGNVTIRWDSNSTKVHRVSFDITIPRVGSQLLGARFVALSKDHRKIQIYLKPTNNIIYTLKYCLKPEYPFVLDIEKNYTCPRYRSVQFSCWFRSSDIYELPNSAGDICQASTVDYIKFYALFKFHIRSKTRDGLNSASSSFRVFTKESNDNLGKDTPGYFTVVLIGRKPGYLNTSVIVQQVSLNWQDTRSELYRINYSCNNEEANYTYKIDSSANIYNKNFAAYILCQFCVASLPSVGSIWSEPACKTIRFPEQPPSQPPIITCNFDTCPTTSFAKGTREVQVECALPENNTRNGLLKWLVVVYYTNENSTNVSKKNVSIDLSMCQVTLHGLNRRNEYYAQMKVCNAKGCSSLSDTVLIARAIQANDTPLKWEWIVIPVCIFMIVAIVMIVYGLYRYCRKPKQMSSLEELKDPNHYEDLDKSKNYKPNEYNELSIGNDNANVVLCNENEN